MKVIDGYVSNILRAVNLKEELTELKSYDGHIFMQDIFPIELKVFVSHQIISTIS